MSAARADLIIGTKLFIAAGVGWSTGALDASFGVRSRVQRPFRVQFDLTCEIVYVLNSHRGGVQTLIRGVSSIGRAPALHVGGTGIETRTLQFFFVLGKALLASTARLCVCVLVRASDCLCICVCLALLG